MASDMQRDEKGRPFFNVQGTNRRSYVSPAAFGEQVPDDNTGMFRQRPQWNNNNGEWETPIDWGNIATVGVGGLAGVAAAPAIAGALGIGGGGAAPTAAATQTATAAAPAAAAGGSGVAATGGMSFGKLAGLGALGTGFDLLGSLLGGGDGQGRKSFAGRRAANGQDIDPGNVYGEGMAGMRQLMPIMQERVTNPKPRLRDVYAQPVAGLSGVDPGYQRRQAGGGGSGMTPEQLAIIRQVLGI